MNTSITPRLLLVDDDVELCELLAEYLSSEGFAVSLAHDGVTGATRAAREPWDVVILDVMMPGMNGFDALRKIKATSSVPVMMLTARGEDTDTVVGLELGADDYVAKPVNPRVLTARLRALLRRGAAEQGAGNVRVGESGAGYHTPPRPGAGHGGGVDRRRI